MDAGWEQILARIYSLVRLSRLGEGPPVTAELVREAARGIEPYEGVPGMFSALRHVAAENLPGLGVEFHCPSSNGLGQSGL